MCISDVLRVVWHDGADEIIAYTVHDDHDYQLAIITRHKITHALYCHRCLKSSRTPCDHIRDVTAYVHRHPEDQ
jgi:hypothetical protein